MKIIITNVVPLNGGDMAILEGIIDILKRSLGNDIEISIFCTQADIARKYYGLTYNFNEQLFWINRQGILSRIPLLRKIIKERVNAFHLWKLVTGIEKWLSHSSTVRLFLKQNELSILEQFRDSDLIISTGGTYLVEHYYLAPKFLDLAIAIKLQKPLVLFTQSLGPFKDVKNQAAIDHIVSNANLVLLRDIQSRENLNFLNQNSTPLVVAPDAAFGLLQTIHSEANKPNTGKLKIAISVRDWSHYRSNGSGFGQEKYEYEMAQTVTELVKNHAVEVTFLSTCQGISEYYFNDSMVGNRILERIDQTYHAAVSVDASFSNPKALIAKLSSYDLVVATRMHMSILAMCAQVPVIGIAYEFKTQELFTKLGMSNWAIDIEDVTHERLSVMIAQALEQRDELRRLIATHIAKEEEGIQHIAQLIQEQVAVSTYAKAGRS